MDGLPGDMDGEGDLALDLVRDLDRLFFFFSWGLLREESILLKDIESNITLVAQLRLLFTLLKAYVALLYRILFMHSASTKIIPHYCTSTAVQNTFSEAVFNILHYATTTT